MNIQFAQPVMLYALAAIAIPIIIHLFNFRRFKKVYFTNVRFLQNLVQESDAKSKLKHLLVLACRILAISALVLAFAQPFIQHGIQHKTTTQGAIQIYVDNSFSMDGQGKQGNLLEQAKQKAREVVTAFKSSDRFQILTNDFESRHQRWYSKEQAVQLIDEIAVSPAVKTTSAVISRLKSAAAVESAGTNTQCYLVSDFQKNTTDLVGIKADTSMDLHLIPLVNQQVNNVSIDTCWLSSPLVRVNAPAELSVKLHYSGTGEPTQLPVKLFVNGIQKSLANADFSKGNTQIVRMPFTVNKGGWQEVKVELKDYPISFDDAYYLAFEVPNGIKIATINGKNSNVYLDALFARDSSFIFKDINENQVDYATLGDNKMLILNELQHVSSGLTESIVNYLKKGGSVVLLPDVNAAPATYQPLLNRMGVRSLLTVQTAEDKINKVEFKSTLYSDVFEKMPENMDLPTVKKYFSFGNGLVTNEEVLLKTRLGNTFMSVCNAGFGKVYLFSCPLSQEASNFAEHALFVPTFLKMAMLSAGVKTQAYDMGGNNDVEISSKGTVSEDNLKIVAAGTDFNIIPERKPLADKILINTRHQIKKAGLYQLMDGTERLASLGFNYNRQESVIDQYTATALSEQLTKAKWLNSHVFDTPHIDLSQAIREQTQGSPLWKYLVVAALLFLAAEVLLLRFYRD